MIRTFWDSLGEKLGRVARAGLVIGASVILLLTVLAAFWVFRTDYQPLFTGLSPQDASSITAELERQKIPYELSDQGNNSTAILVDRHEVYSTRIKLMGKDIPLHGTVGFELFNTNDFGMTEFAQKINYQRALQGELTRTILSLSEIRDARVLLALPDQGLFKQATNRPKASVTLTLKEGQRLRLEQVNGIQRLVASSVPGIVPQDVTLVNQDGMALSRPADADVEGGAGGAYRLDLKRETEAYLSRKAQGVLDRALGPGQAMASVDVTLDMDRVQSSTDEVLSAPGGSDGAPTGVVTHQREATRDSGPPLGIKAGADASASGGGSNQNETDYAVGHHVEQVISQPGSIRQLQVAVVVQKALTSEQQDQLRATVAASVGASTDRGDAIVIQPLQGLMPAPPAAAGRPAPPTPSADAGKEPSSEPFHAKASNLLNPVAAITLSAIAGLALLGMALARPRRETAASKTTTPLSEVERQAALAQVRLWLGRSEVPSNSPRTTLSGERLP